MVAADWVVREDRLRLLTEDGRVIDPTAREVFRAVFNERREISGCSVNANPVEALSHLHFSRYPAGPAIKISGSPLGGISAELGIDADGDFAPVPLGADQTLVALRWYPVDVEARHDAEDWLSGRGIDISERLGLGALIQLRAAHDGPFRLFDEVDVQTGAPSDEPGQSEEPIPEVRADLYPYQREGVRFLQLIAAQQIGCLLADEMGLGKTLQVIALLVKESTAGRWPSLVLAPATLLENWRREIAQFAPGLTAYVHAGAARAGIASTFGAFDVVVTSYDTAVRDEPLLMSLHWNVVVLDEAQAIKNPDAQRTIVAKRIPRRVSVAVTGTPVENRLEDLWSLSDFALPGLLGELSEFRSQYENDLHDASRLASVVAPIVLRRRVAEVAKDLPELIEIPQAVQMNRSLAQLYEQIRLDTLDKYGSAASMVAMTRLRMLCCHPLLSDSDGQRLFQGDPSVGMPKYQRLLEILEEVFSKGEKALIFSSYQGMADILMSDIPVRWSRGYFRFIDGRVPVPERQPIVDGLFKHQGAAALFLNPKAAGTGLNITAANHVIHYNPEWNPALTDQASRRAYRRRQDLPVTVHYLYFADSVEEVIMGRAGFKRDLADGAVTGHKGEVDADMLARALSISPLAFPDRLPEE